MRRPPHSNARDAHRKRFLQVCAGLLIFCGKEAVTRQPLLAAQNNGPQTSAVHSPSGSALAPSPASRIKVADGEYEIYEEANGGAVGPAGEEIYNFHESWTLWRDGAGQYEVEGNRQFESPRYVGHADRFVAQLSRDLTLLRITEYARLPWRRDPAPTTCEFLREELHCFSAKSTATQKVHLHIPMQSPYGFLWPVSPFSLSGLTRQAERDVNRPMAIQLVSVEESSPKNAVYPVVRSGELQYAGVEHIKAADRDWQAYKFSLKVPTYPTFWIWTSSDGLLLSVKTVHADPHWPPEGMKLLRFHKWAEFSAHAER